MKKIPYQTDRTFVFCLSVIFVLLFSLPAMAGADIETLFQNKTLISQKIDSLDILKQDLKRSGKSVAELDQKQAQLRNSLDKIRDRIQELAIANTRSGARRHQKVSHFIQKPRSLFDWVIIIVGIIATFSGIFLISGIIRNMTRIRKDRIKQQETPDNKTSTAIHSAHPDSSYPYKPIREEAPPATPPPSSTTSPDMATLYALKKRISTPPPSAPEEQQPLSPVIEDAPAAKPLPSQQPSKDAEAPLEQRVLGAAKQGMDTATISKTFHISADHVALIVKMAHRSHN